MRIEQTYMYNKIIERPAICDAAFSIELQL